jgi:hypothetical protein
MAQYLWLPPQSIYRLQGKPSSQRKKENKNPGWTWWGGGSSKNSWPGKAKVQGLAGRRCTAGLLQQIYWHDVSGSSPDFSLVAFTACLLKSPLC